ncbi:MAG: HDOD domain-containing protein [Vicinamibacterales bacterium]
MDFKASTRWPDLDSAGGPPPVTVRLRRRQCELPPMPAVATTLLSLLAKEHVGLAEVSAAIAVDPTVTAEVLRAANSAYYGIRGEVTNLQHAATLLGLERIRALAVTIGVRRYLGTTLAAPAVRRCWRHNLACALTADQLARRCGGHRGDAYTAGLLHDLGRLALVVAHPTAYPAFLDTTRATGARLLAEERDLFAMDHCEAGQWFTAQLLLPQGFQDVARHHHDAAAVGPTDLLARIGVACRLADHLGYWVVVPTPPDEATDAAAAIDALLEPLAPAHRASIASELDELAAEVAHDVGLLDDLLAA